MELPDGFDYFAYRELASKMTGRLKETHGFSRGYNLHARNWDRDFESFMTDLRADKPRALAFYALLIAERMDHGAT